MKEEIKTQETQYDMLKISTFFLLCGSTTVSNMLYNLTFETHDRILELPFIFQSCKYLLFWCAVFVFCLFIAFYLNIMNRSNSRTMRFGKNINMVYKIFLYYIGPLLHTFLYSQIKENYCRGLILTILLLMNMFYWKFIIKPYERILQKSELVITNFLITFLYFYLDKSDTKTFQNPILFAISLGYLIIFYFDRNASETHSFDIQNSIPLPLFIYNQHNQTLSAINMKANEIFHKFEYNSPSELFNSTEVLHKDGSALNFLKAHTEKLAKTEEILLNVPYQNLSRTSKIIEMIIFPLNSNIGIVMKEQSKETEFEHQLKAGFLSTLSHELCTPLNGLLPLLRMETSTDTKNHEMMLNNAELLYSRILDLLDYTKLEMHEIKHSLQQFEVCKLFDELCSLFKYEAEAKMNKLSFTIYSKDRLRIIGDRQRIKQIIIKLVCNAIKHTNRGLVEITAKALRNSNDVQFSVMDTGAGMSDKIRQELFAPISRKHFSFEKPWNPLRLSGMGLRICHKICMSLGAKLEVSSEPRKGSIFCFTLTNARIVDSIPQRTSERLRFTPNLLASQGSFKNVKRAVNADRKKVRKASKDVEINYVSDFKRPLSKMKSERALKTDANKSPESIELNDQCSDVADELLIPEKVVKLPVRMLHSNIDVVQQSKKFQEDDIRKNSSMSEDDLKKAGLLMRQSYYSKENKRSNKRMYKKLSSNYEQIQRSTFMEHEHINEKFKPHLHAISSKALKVSGDMIGFRDTELDNFDILIVDDVACNRYVLRKMLSKFTVNILEASDGLQAYEIIKNEFEVKNKETSIQLIFMDLEMPRMDGIESTRKIRNMEYELKRSIEIPIIAVTAFDTESIRKACREARMQHFITKPIDFKTLQEILNKYYN